MHPSTSMLRLYAACTLAALLAPSAFAQTTATTDPVGFVTVPVIADNSGNGTGGISIVSLGLTQPVSYQGNAEGIGASTLTDSDANWTGTPFSGASGKFFVEITSGPKAGLTSDITGNSSTTVLTLADNLNGVVGTGVTFKIRKHWTIGSVFGSGAGLTLAGGSASTADQLLLWNNTISNYDTYYYQTSGIGGTGWRKSGAPLDDASAQVIYPDDGVVVIRKQATPVNVVVLGAVKTGQSSIPVVSGVNVLANVYAAGMTLADSGLYNNGDTSTGLAGGTGSSADQVLLWNYTIKNYDTYYYQTSGIGGTGWRKSGAPLVDAGTTTIPVGTAVTIIRKFASGFNWVAPQHPTTL